MKNVLFNYEEYRDDIIQNSIYIKTAFFAGIKFGKEEYNDMGYIVFQLVSDENKTMTLNFVMKFDDQDDYDTYYLAYSDLEPIGVAKSLRLPSLMQVSCFYKSKKTGSQDTYVIYAKYDKVYKLEFNKASFLYVMSTFESIRDQRLKDYNGSYFIANLPDDIKTIKIHSTYTPIIKAVMLNKVGKGFDWFYYGGYIVDFTECRTGEVIRLVCSLAEDKSFKKRLDRSKLSTQEQFDKIREDLYNNEFVTVKGDYSLLDTINTEYSLSANTPMSNYTIIAKSNKNEKTMEVVYLDISSDMYANVQIQLYNFLEK